MFGQLLETRVRRNLITDVAGVRVGHADDAKLGSGATVVLFDEPAVAAALRALRAGIAPTAGLVADLTALAGRYEQGVTAAGAPAADVRIAFYRRHSTLAVLAALGADPAEAARQAAWRAGSAIGGDFADQLRLEVLRRLIDRARGIR